MLLTTLPFILSAASLVAGQVDPSLVSPCILNCVNTAAAANGCNGIQDLPCICWSDPFKTAAAQCLVSSCTNEEQATATQLQNTLCVGVSPPIVPPSGGSISISPSASLLPSGIGSVTGPSSSEFPHSFTIQTSEPAGSGAGTPSPTAPPASVTPAPSTSTPTNNAHGVFGSAPMIAALLVGAFTGALVL